MTSYGNKRGVAEGYIRSYILSLTSWILFPDRVPLTISHQELCLWKDYSIRPGRKIKHSDVRLQTIKKGCEFNVYKWYYLELQVLRGEYILHV